MGAAELAGGIFGDEPNIAAQALDFEAAA